MGYTLYFVTLYIITILLIVIVLVSMQRRTTKNIEVKLSDYEREKNLLINAPVLNELLKVEALVKNNKLEDKYKTWQTKFDYIKGSEIPFLTDLLIETDHLLEKKNFNKIPVKLTEIEIKLYEIRTKICSILGDIKEITQSEEKNRNTVTRLKAIYRSIRKKYDSARSDYSEISKVIDMQLESIEKRFQEFEDVMEKYDYEEVVYIVKGLTEMVNHANIIVEEIPGIMLLGKSLIPKRMEDISTEYIKMTREGYQLDYLNIEYNISETEKKISGIFDRVKVLNLEHVTFELKTILEYYDLIYTDFEKEKLARKKYDEAIEVFIKKNRYINKVLDSLIVKVPELKKLYNLSDDSTKFLKLISSELNILNKDFDKLCNLSKQKAFPYSRLLKEIEIIILKINKLQDKFDNLVQNIGSMKEDEERAKSQLSDIKILLKQAKYKIRKNKLPILTDSYYTELTEASDAIIEIQKELQKKPIDIETLNIRVDTARDLVFKLFNTTNSMIKLALLAEHSIVYGNKYRSNKQSINDGLIKAEKLYFQGNYKKSLDTSISTLDVIDPRIHKKILELYKNKTI